MAVSMSLHLGLPSEPLTSNFCVFSNDRRMVLSISCHIQGTLSDLFSLHSFRALLPISAEAPGCSFFQADELGSSDFSIFIDPQTLLADMNGYWFITSHPFDDHNLSALGAPQPSAPPESDFDSGPLLHAQPHAVAQDALVYQALEHAPSVAAASAPPEGDFFDAVFQPPVPAPDRGASAASAPLSSDALLNHQVQSSIRCPITLEPFVDPVIAADGHTYERSAIMQLFGLDRPSRVSPLTRAPFANYNLIPNFSMRSLVRDAGHVPDRAEVGSADISLGSFNNYVDLRANDVEEPLLARDRMRNNVPRGQGLAHQIDTLPLPIRFQEKTSSLCCHYTFLVFFLCALACCFNDFLTSQLQSLSYFQVWQDIFNGQLPVCFFLSTAIGAGAFCAVLMSCPSYYFPGFCCTDERSRKGLVLLVALVVPVGAVVNFGLPVPIFLSEYVLKASAIAYFFWSIFISIGSALFLLSWSRNALYSWNIAPPVGIEAEIPLLPFTSSFARIVVALSLALMIGLFTVLFALSVQLGQLLSLSLAVLCLFVFIVALLFQSVRTFNMCKDLAFAQPWFLHSLAVAVALLVFETIWLCQGLLTYKLPSVDPIFQSFIPLGSFSNEVFQRLWFMSGLGVFDAVFFISGLSVLAKLNQGGYRVDLGTHTRKFYGKWWLALLVSILAIPFIVASSTMPLCLQTDMLDILPNYVPWVVVMTKFVQCCLPAVVWVFAPTFRFQHASDRNL